MSARLLGWFGIGVFGFAGAAQAGVLFSGEKKLNNLVSELLVVPSGSDFHQPFKFARSSEGWILVSASCQGNGSATIMLHTASGGHAIKVGDGGRGRRGEAMCYVTKGEHSIQVDWNSQARVDRLVVKTIPELIHCGLGLDPAIKSYGRYDWDFLKEDILPNVTTLVVPNSLKLPEIVIEDWHRQGKRFIAEVGIHSQGQTADDHFQYWSGSYERTPFLDGILINEFIVNRPVIEWAQLTPERLARMQHERGQYELYAEAIQKLRADDRFKEKALYAYVGGSAKKLNREIIGTNCVRTLVQCGYRIALERYLHEMSSEQGAADALQAFVDGISDWEAKEPGVKKQMVIAFGLLSMPPGSLNKLPNVDYHVWMDQQMNVVANHPALSGLGGLEWWTSLLADEETVRFVGKLYRHYAIDGKTNRFTHDPLFLTHLQNADFAHGTEGWNVHPAEEGSVAIRSFPRYGRIEGRFMGLGRPPDPEHIGDTFLWMKRSRNGPNQFSQTIKDLEPGRLYSLKMLSCDYQDLVNPKTRKQEEATGFIGSVILEDVELDAQRSFSEMYTSSPEPSIPVWITYHWKVFRAQGTTATLTVSDWPNPQEPGDTFAQEQIFNFLEVQPYWE